MKINFMEKTSRNGKRTEANYQNDKPKEINGFWTHFET